MLLVIAVLAGACARPPPSVVIILVDTFRSDRLDAFGGERRLMPMLDGLAARSSVFRNAYASSAWTSPSVASLFTSRHPSQHGISDFGSILAEEEQTLAEALRARGYATGGFSANGLIRKQLGYDQGFDRFETQRVAGATARTRSERAIETGKRALAWLDSLPPDAQAPVFLYLHLMNPHAPYDPPRPSLRRVFGPGALPDVDATNELIWAKNELSDASRLAIERLYDAEVNGLEAELGSILLGLEHRGLFEDALVVVVADHGEEFWEHGGFGHGQSLYDELVRVPLLVHAPGQAHRIEVEQPVSLIDLAPTLLEAVGEDPPPHFAGRSLWPYLNGGARRTEPAEEAPAVVSELLRAQILRRGPLQHERAVVIGSSKLIVEVDGTRHYFERSTDPGERGVAPLPESRRRALDQAHDRFVAGIESRPTADVAPLDDETRAELQALGYLE